MAPQALDDVHVSESEARPAEPAPVRRHRRSPTLAACLSVILGGGQLYNGQPKKAAVFLTSTLATIGPAILLITAGERIGTNLLNSHRFTLFLLVAFASIVVFLGLFLLGLAFWASSIVDARRSAEELNAGVHDPSAGRWWFFRL